MTVSVQSRTGDEQQIMEQMQRNVLSQLRVSLVSIIQSFDPDRPGVKKRRISTGTSWCATSEAKST